MCTFAYFVKMSKKYALIYKLCTLLKNHPELQKELIHIFLSLLVCYSLSLYFSLQLDAKN